MKQKRTYVTSLLVVAILCLGIAYAAFTADVLTINGVALADIAPGSGEINGEVDVVFTEAPLTGERNEGTETDYNAENDTATFTVAGLTTVGDTQTVTFGVENQTENGVPVTLEAPDVVCGNTEWYKVTCEYDKTSLGAYDAGSNVDDTAILTVTVELLKTVSTEAEKTAANTDNTITITLNAEAANN